MTIDERIERLTERHEALAQSVELLTHQMRNLEVKTEIMLDSQEVTHRELRTFGALLGEFSGRVAATLERLTTLTGGHQERLNLHQQRLDTLEGAT